MRVTANTFPDTLTGQLAILTMRQNRLQNQAATGQKFEWPEDDPTAMRRVLDLQTESKNVSQYQENVSRLKEMAQANYSVLKSLNKISDRAGEIAVLADDTKSPEELKVYATELTQLISQAVQVTQTKFRGDYLMGGTKTDQAPFVMSTDASGNVTSVVYQGNQSDSECEIAENVTVSVQVFGENNTGAGPRGVITDSRYGADFFNHLISLQNHLNAGDTASIASTDRQNLAKDEENLLLHMGSNGAVQGRLESAGGILQQRIDSNETTISSQADADLATTLVRLNQTQTAYKAALQSGASLLQQSLLDYIR
jgi:flagellar hook-associated protein 3 FlgL